MKGIVELQDEDWAMLTVVLDQRIKQFREYAEEQEPGSVPEHMVKAHANRLSWIREEMHEQLCNAGVLRRGRNTA